MKQWTDKKTVKWLRVMGSLALLVVLLLSGGTYAFAAGKDSLGVTIWGKVRVVLWAIGIIAALCILAFALKVPHWNRLRAEGQKVRFKKTVNGLLSLATVIFVALIVVANIAGSTFSNALNLILTPNFHDVAQVATTKDDWKNLSVKINDEGMTLLRNNNQTLPLAEGTKVNLLGYYAYNPYYSGSGSGKVSAADSVDIRTALDQAGITVNPALLDNKVYVAEGPNTNLGMNWADLSNSEISVDKFTGDASFTNLAQYSDTAIYVIGRTGGEDTDLTGYKAKSGDETDYLKLSNNEKDILSKARAAFKHLIVVINSDNPLNMSFLNDYDVDACIWAGIPGPYGFTSLGKILSGEVNPSGRVTDTWTYNYNSNPVTENFGNQSDSHDSSIKFVDYVEGIYVGYKWFETAYAEKAKITNTDTHETFNFGDDYDSIVAYPFGYGLSYTSFSQEIVDTDTSPTLDPHGSTKVKVRVTNTGNVAGKNTVQLYVTTPYTDYDKENGVEKSAVSLAAFAKTDTLDPGQSQDLTLTVNAEDIASYDYKYRNADDTYGSYMLDAGTYEFSIRSDAHSVLDTTTRIVSDQYFYSGDHKRSTDKHVASNQFKDAARGQYLSRNNGFANYADVMNSVKELTAKNSFETNPNAYADTLDKAVTKKYVKGVDYDADGDLKFSDMEGAAYDDPRWKKLISQMSLKELQSLYTDATYASPVVPSISKNKRSMDSDGPLGISSMFNVTASSVGYTSVPMIAATFNTKLAHEWGSQIADQAKLKGMSGLYGPAMNMHRSAYSGRNYEYPAEDSVLAGTISAAQVNGARKGGLAVYIKHFALNDQETNRIAVHTYSNEQAIREIYLKPFEEAVKAGGANALMTSMNDIGDTFSGAHVGLLTHVLRDEWNFKGKVVSDMAGANQTQGSDACLRAGLDGWLSATIPVKVSAKSDADIYYLQRAAHNTLYTLSNTTYHGIDPLNWHGAIALLCVEFGVMAAVCMLSIILRSRPIKRVAVESMSK